MRVLIVGAGPTGLTTALGFAQHGVLPEIVDAKDSPSWKSRAVVVLPRSIEVLNQTGVGAALEKAGMRITKVQIHRDEKRLIDLDMAEVLGESAYIIGLAQDETETIMSEHLARMGVSVSYGTEVVGVETTDHNARVTFADGTTRTYDWVVGADGVSSTVREALEIPYEGYELAEDWSIADVELTHECEYQQISAWLLAGDQITRDALVRVPIGKKRIRLVSSTPDSLDALPRELDIDTVRRSGMFKISVRNAQDYVRGRVVLAGDAAHTHSPVGGRGMNLGIEDGQAAAQAIVANTVTAYAATRRRKAIRVIRGTERIRKLAVSNNPFVVPVVYIVAWCIQHSTFIQRRFLKNLIRL